MLSLSVTTHSLHVRTSGGVLAFPHSFALSHTNRTDASPYGSLDMLKTEASYWPLVSKTCFTKWSARIGADQSLLDAIMSECIALHDLLYMLLFLSLQNAHEILQLRQRKCVPLGEEQIIKSAISNHLINNACVHDRILWKGPSLEREENLKGKLKRIQST